MYSKCGPEFVSSAKDAANAAGGTFTLEIKLTFQTYIFKIFK